MRTRHLLLLLPLACLFACSDSAMLQAQLTAAQSQIRQLRDSLQQVGALEEGPLHHYVLLDFKEEVDLTSVWPNLEKLGTLPTVQSFELGEPADTGDPRATLNYDIALIMTFQGYEQLAVYQKDETHLAIRASLKEQLAGPPLVIDLMAN